MYIIIGASSFIGVYTANEFLNQGCDVLVTGRGNRFKDYYRQKGIAYVDLDLEKKEDFDRLPKEKVDGVILLAGLLPANAKADLNETENAQDYIRVNTTGAIYALEYCRINGIKRLLSTVSFADVAGAYAKDYAITEQEPRNFSFTGDHAVYVISKNAASDIMEYYNQQHAMKNAWFRLPPVYGVGPHGSLLVNGKTVKSGLQIFIEQASKGLPIEVYGDGSLSRDVVYVKDVAHAFYLAMKSENTYGLYNIAAGRGTTLKEQAETAAEIFAPDSRHKSEVKYRPEKADNSPSYLFSIEKARRDFGYCPQFPTFRDMMTDYKKELDRNEYGALFLG